MKVNRIICRLDGCDMRVTMLSKLLLLLDEMADVTFHEPVKKCSRCGAKELNGR